MAEAFVEVTPGSGKKLHTFNRTIGANSVEDEVVLLGEQYLASYTVTAQMSLTTAASHLLQIMAGASLKVRIRRIELWQASVATTAGFMNTQLYRLSSAGTGGTPITPGLLDPADSASGATGMSLPSAKGTETTLIARAEPWLMQTVTASAEKTGPIVVWDFDRLRSKPLIIAAGTANGVAIKNTTGMTPAVCDITVWFDESSF